KRYHGAWRESSGPMASTYLLESAQSVAWQVLLAPGRSLKDFSLEFQPGKLPHHRAAIEHPLASRVAPRLAGRRGARWLCSAGAHSRGAHQRARRCGRRAERELAPAARNTCLAGWCARSAAGPAALATPPSQRLPHAAPALPPQLAALP